MNPTSDTALIEEGTPFRPRFGSAGLITAVVSDERTGVLLMVAHMNEEALDRTLQTGEAWYWSRSRGQLWHKGETSGQIQTVAEMRVDCDQDCLWLKVRVGGDGGACHTGRLSCFYRLVERSADGLVSLRFDDLARPIPSFTPASPA